MRDDLTRIEQEMVNVRKEAAAMAAGISAVNDEMLESPAGFLLVEGMASAVEKVFTGLERCLTFIARDIDKTANIKSDNWHAALLIQMSTPYGHVRPAILSQDLLARLDVLRAFRHRERNTYGFNLDAARIREIATSVSETLDLFSGAIADLSVELDRREEQKRLEQERQAQKSSEDQAEESQPDPG
jgi:hypothetical protein